MQHFVPSVFVAARPSPTGTPRHARLFELIRQQTLSGALSKHIDSHGEDLLPDGPQQAFCRDFLAKASLSLGHSASSG